MEDTKIEITLSDGSKHILNHPDTLCDIDNTRLSSFVFESGEIYTGYTNGEVDEEEEFCLTKPTVKYGIALPFDRLIGWYYDNN